MDLAIISELGQHVDWFIVQKHAISILLFPTLLAHAGRRTNAGCRTKFAPGTSLLLLELFLELSLFEFRFTVFFPLGCGVDS